MMSNGKRHVLLWYGVGIRHAVDGLQHDQGAHRFTSGRGWNTRQRCHRRGRPFCHHQCAAGRSKIDARGRVKQEAINQAEVDRIFQAALAAQPPKPISFILYFEEGQTQVTPESQARLEALFAEVDRRQAVEVQITGHTDRVGSVADNDRLSLARAQAVWDMLGQLGLRSDFIRAVGRESASHWCPRRTNNRNRGTGASR